MLGNILSSFTGDSVDRKVPSRRRHSRRSCDKCVTVVNGKMYPVVDWSIGGLQISGDERTFSMNEEMNVVMKFQLRDDILEVPHQARVVRKNNGRVAFEFLPLDKETRNKFQNVVDDQIASEFSDSQLI